jgi:hypothetical protein
MSIPRVEGAFCGWTKRREVWIITKTVENFLTRQTAEIVTMDIMVAPLQPEAVKRLPESQRAWKWFDVLVKSSSRPLTVDCQIVVDGIVYLIDSIQNWKEAGYRRYLATENVTGVKTMYPVTYLGNGNTAGNPPGKFAYMAGADVLVSANTMTLTGSVFVEWNTAADGTGTGYDPGDTLTIGSAPVTLYAIWEAVP